MRLRTIQVIAALVAAVAFVLAFMAAGLAAVGWLAWSLVRQVRRRDRNRTASGSV